MDPTFRRQLLDYLESDDVQKVVGEEAQEKLIAQIGGVEIHPHVVHVKATFEDEDQSVHEEVDGDEPGTKKEKVKAKTVKVRRQVVNNCPDCKRGLTSRGVDMICPLLPRTLDLHDDNKTHVGCVIACGTDGSV